MRERILLLIFTIAFLPDCGNLFSPESDIPFVGIWRSERTGQVGPDGEPFSYPLLYFTQDRSFAEDNEPLGFYTFNVVGATATYEVKLILDNGETVTFRARVEDNRTRLAVWYVDERTSVRGPHRGNYHLVHTLE